MPASVALHRVRGGMDADMVVRADGVLEEAVVDLCRGQDMDVCPDVDERWVRTVFELRRELCERFERRSLAWYREMIRLKPGVLTGAAAGIGAIIAGGNYERGARSKVFGIRREGIPDSGRELCERFERRSLTWYREMVRLKTGVLTATAAGIGAIIAGGNYERGARSAVLPAPYSPPQNSQRAGRRHGGAGGRRAGGSRDPAMQGPGHGRVLGFWPECDPRNWPEATSGIWGFWHGYDPRIGHEHECDPRTWRGYDPRNWPDAVGRV